MTRTRYEVHLRGHLPPDLRRRFGVATEVKAPPETVLVTESIDQQGLAEVISRLEGLGLELLELRRGRAGSGECRGTVLSDRASQVGSYEIRVHGLLGPLLLSTIPHTAAVRVERHSILITEWVDGPDLVELMQLIVGSGLEVDSIRAALPEAEGELSGQGAR